MRPSWLTVEAYAAAERQALITAPNRIVECCRPVTFMHESYPVDIPSDGAAQRYVDVMQDGRSEGTFASLLGGITPDEMAAMHAVAAKVANLTKREYGKRAVPRSGLLRALNVVRHLRFVFPKPPATILEIGGGSAYVGALLLEFGYTYVLTDVTQAFYLWQNHLLHEMTDGNLAELALDDGDFFSGLDGRRAVHVPWWKFVVPSPAIDARVDGVTCSHALCELHPNALAYTLKVSHALIDLAQNGCFLFEGWGSTVRRPIAHAGRGFSQAGFVFALNDVLSSVAVRSDSPAKSHAMVLPATKPRRASEDERFHPNIHVDKRNPLGALILEGRARTKRDATLQLHDFDSMLSELLGSDDLSTGDERFMRFIGSA